jgi:hypothetical protein
MTTFQRELAAMEKIGGIRICPVEAPDGTLYMDAQIALAKEPETESEADRKFIESGEKIRAANRLLPKKKRFSWAGLFALLAVAAVVMLLTYWAVDGF